MLFFIKSEYILVNKQLYVYYDAVFYRTLPSAVLNETAFITSIYHEPCDHWGSKSCSEECEVWRLRIFSVSMKSMVNVYIGFSFNEGDRH